MNTVKTSRLGFGDASGKVHGLDDIEKFVADRILHADADRSFLRTSMESLRVRHNDPVADSWMIDKKVLGSIVEMYVRERNHALESTSSGYSPNAVSVLLNCILRSSQRESTPEHDALLKERVNAAIIEEAQYHCLGFVKMLEKHLPRAVGTEIGPGERAR